MKPPVFTQIETDRSLGMLVLDEPWTSEHEDFVSRYNIRGLDIRVDIDDTLRDLSFLRRVDNMVALKIASVEDVDLNPIYSQPGLAYLNASPFGSRTRIDFSRFAKLRYCYLGRVGNDGIFGCRDLEYLHTYHARCELSRLPELGRLKSLQLNGDNKTTNLDFLERMPGLVSLGVIRFTKLSNVAAIKNCAGLVDLKISCCKKNRQH